MTAGGLKCRVSKDLRGEIWVKLLGNATFNPLSALTGATMAELCDVRADADAAGGHDGRGRRGRGGGRLSAAHLRSSADSRLPSAVGDHKTSMLQDLEGGQATRARSPRRGSPRDRRHGARRPAKTADRARRHRAARPAAHAAVTTGRRARRSRLGERDSLHLGDADHTVGSTEPVGRRASQAERSSSVCGSGRSRSQSPSSDGAGRE